MHPDEEVINSDVIAIDSPIYAEIIKIAQLCLEHIHDRDLAIIAFEAIVARM